MATTLTAGTTSGIALANLKSIEVEKTSKVITFKYADGSTAKITVAADADDFVANALPYLGGQAQIEYFPNL